MKSINKITFNDVSKEWLLFKKNQVKESTFYNYKFVVCDRLGKKFGNIKIESLKNYNFNKYVQDLTKKYSPKTVRDTFSIMKSVLKYIERKYDLDYKLDLLSAPKYYRKQIKIFSKKEKKRMERRIIHSYSTKDIGILIGFYTGMRIGEVCALKWSDIDFEQRIIHVEHTIQRLYSDDEKSRITFSDPKTKTSFRDIPLARILYDKLKEFYTIYRPQPNYNIITGKPGNGLEPMSFRYHYKKF